MYLLLGIKTLLSVSNSSLEGASDRLVNFVISCLQEEKVAHPRGMEEMLKDLLGDGKKLLSDLAGWNHIII